jgi:drug/metabolite transporter (DMT)-like permease
MTDLGVVYLGLTVAGYGGSTVLLRKAILDGRTNDARLYRTLVQTVLVAVAFVAVAGPGGFAVPVNAGALFAATNGALSGLAFVLYSRGLETVEASTAKPALASGMVVSVTLGILVLGESVSARKVAGVALAGLAIYLLAGD